MSPSQCRSLVRSNECQLPDLDLERGVAIRNALLRDPRAYDEHMRALRAWRDEFELTLARRPANDPGLIVEQYRRIWETVSADAEEVRGALLNVERINDIQKVLDAMLDKLGGESFGNGGIDVPSDMRVVSVFASAGEHLAEGRPVLSARERFRCRARAFATSKEVSDLGLMPMSVWKVAVNGLTEAAPDVWYVCIVGRVEPDEANVWVIDLDIFAAIRPDIAGVSNLPRVLPLSSRYMQPVVPTLTGDVLNTVEESLPVYGTATVEFLEQLH